MQPLERLGESTDLRLLNDVVDLICEKKDLTAVIYDICNYPESDSACVYGKLGLQQLKYPARIPPVN